MKNIFGKPAKIADERANRQLLSEKIILNIKKTGDFQSGLTGVSKKFLRWYSLEMLNKNRLTIKRRTQNIIYPE